MYNGLTPLLFPSKFYFVYLFRTALCGHLFELIKVQCCKAKSFFNLWPFLASQILTSLYPAKIDRNNFENIKLDLKIFSLCWTHVIKLFLLS